MLGLFCLQLILRLLVMFTKFSCISTPDLSKHVVFFNTEDIIIISIDVNLWPFDTLAIFHSVVFTHIR